VTAHASAEAKKRKEKTKIRKTIKEKIK